MVLVGPAHTFVHCIRDFFPFCFRTQHFDVVILRRTCGCRVYLTAFAVQIDPFIFETFVRKDLPLSLLVDSFVNFQPRTEIEINARTESKYHRFVNRMLTMDCFCWYPIPIIILFHVMRAKTCAVKAIFPVSVQAERIGNFVLEIKTFTRLLACVWADSWSEIQSKAIFSTVDSLLLRWDEINYSSIRWCHGAWCLLMHIPNDNPWPLPLMRSIVSGTRKMRVQQHYHYHFPYTTYKINCFAAFRRNGKMKKIKNKKKLDAP